MPTRPKKVRAEPAQNWDALGAEAEPRRLSLPLSAFLLEAKTLAAFVRRHWAPGAPSRKGPAPPGLAGAARVAGFGPEIADEIEAIAERVEAMGSARSRRVARDGAPVARANAVLRELRLAMEFGLRDARGQAQVKKLRAATGTPQSRAALALALATHAELARARRDGLIALIPDLPALLTEALELRQRLETDSARSRSEELESQRRNRLRSGLVRLLLDRVNLVRRAARFAFRDHPELVRKATSAYGRARRLKNLRKRRQE